MKEHKSMKAKPAPKARPRAEAGVVLLIAIFVLMLVSVAGIALIVSSGTESALAANYRSSATVYYAAMAGLEEARGRLQPKNPDYFNNTQAGFIPTGGAPLQLGQVRYVINQAPGEVVDPTDPGNPYYDREYAQEFPANPITDLKRINSISGTNAGGIPGPIFKWVRINAVTEVSLNLDVNGNGEDPTTLLYYDASHTDASGNVQPSLIVSTSPPPTATQALETTALAVLPNGSQKVLQYVVASNQKGLNLPAALVLDGVNVAFTAASTPGTAMQINGADQFGVGSCNPGASPVSAVGYTATPPDSSQGNITIETNQSSVIKSQFSGAGGSPSVNYVGQPSPMPVPFALDPSLTTLDGLSQLVKRITDSADVKITPAGGYATQNDLPLNGNSIGSPDHPLTVVVNGDLDTTNWGPTGYGYGLLLVTGKFTYDTEAHWRGVVLVIGQGDFAGTSYNPSPSGDIWGGVLIARTLDASGNPLANLGSPSFNQGAHNGGILYSSCWVQAANVRLPAGMQVLSFREIPQ